MTPLSCSAAAGVRCRALAAAGISFSRSSLINRVTCGAVAYSGIPLTHRDYANSCLFVAGHLKNGSMDLDWDSLFRPGRTLAVQHGLLGLATLCRELVARGAPAAIPAAIAARHDVEPAHGGRDARDASCNLRSPYPAPPTLIIGDGVLACAALHGTTLGGGSGRGRGANQRAGEPRICPLDGAVRTSPGPLLCSTANTAASTRER